MGTDLRGRKIILQPLKGESDFDKALEGSVEGTLQRHGIKKMWEYYVVKLDAILTYKHPSPPVTLELDRVLVLPDDTHLEWAFFGGGPPGLPVLVKVFGVLPGPGPQVTDYGTGETFLLARAIAEAPP